MLLLCGNDNSLLVRLTQKHELGNFINCWLKLQKENNFYLNSESRRLKKLQKTVKECEKLNQPQELFKLAPKQLVAEKHWHYKNPKKKENKGTVHFSFPHEIYYKNHMNRVYKFIFHENKLVSINRDFNIHF